MQDWARQETTTAKAVPILMEAVLLMSAVCAHPYKMGLDPKWMSACLKP